MRKVISISVSPEFKLLAKQFKVSWTEAARIGMAIILAERGAKQFDNNIIIQREINLIEKQIKEFDEKLKSLKAKLK